MGMGLQAGAQTTDILISLGTDEAVHELWNSGRVRFGGDAVREAEDATST